MNVTVLGPDPVPVSVTGSVPTVRVSVIGTSLIDVLVLE